MQNLILIRIKSIIWTVFGVAVAAILAFVTSADFATLLQEHGVSAGVVTVITIAITELLKHIRNRRELGKVRLGSKSADSIVLI